MPIHSASTSHTNHAAALSQPSTPAAGTSHHTTFACAIRQITSSVMRLATGAQTHQAEADIPVERNRLKNLDTESMFSLYANSRSRHLRKAIVKCYASRKSARDWQTDWNNQAPSCQTASLRLLLRVKAIKDQQAASSSHAGHMDVNGGNLKGMSHLVYAAINGNVSSIDLLLDTAGIDLHKGRRGWNAFLYAADNGHTGVVRRLLQTAGNLINSRTESGTTALMLAVRQQHIETIRLLLHTEGIDTGIKNKSGDTALMMARIQGNKKILYLLQAHENYLQGAITTNSREEITGTHLQSGPSDSEFVFSLYSISSEPHFRKKLIQFYADRKSHEDWQTDWNNQAQECRATSIEFLLDVKKFKESQEPYQNSQMDVHQYHEQAFPHLMQAAEYGDVYAIKLLLDNGINPYAVAFTTFSSGDISNPDTEIFGWNALSQAASNGHTDAVKELLRAANGLIHTCTTDNETALMLAVRNQQTETIKLLLSIHSMNANYRSIHGESALTIACSIGDIDAIALLLPVTRASLNVGTNDGDTPLIKAVMFGHTSAVHLLLRTNGINIGISNQAGDTALMMAQKKGYKEIENLLQAHTNYL